MKITFIGGGNMASAMIGGLLKKDWPADAIRVVEIDPAARARIESNPGVKADPVLSTDNASADCIVLAVKPQQLREATHGLRPYLAGQLVISIAAGLRLADLSNWMGGYANIVRVMPNTPALVLAGISGLCALPGVTQEGRTRAAAIIGAIGSTIWVEHEEQLDAITAVSGSGPAYVFYFIEALQQAAVELGFASAEARRLALETFAGAVKLAQAGNEDAATLRARVTSKGGTTERALGVMEDAAVKAIILRAVRAAAQRSRELGDELGGD